MEHVWRHYNTLPSILEAHHRFSDRKTCFSAAEVLFSKYPDGFGLCLIHAHCKLTEGEIMLADGNVSKPVHVSDGTEYYPERWLPSGEPYEFTTKPTKTPSASFLEDFRATFASNTVLGLCCLEAEHTGDNQSPRIEWTEGRTNKMRKISQEDMSGDPIPTSWTIGDGITTMTWCNQYCFTESTSSGGYHKGQIVHEIMS